MLVFVLAILPLQNATEAYNSAVEEYNAAAEDYNSMLSLTCVDNLDGFPESAENLEMVNEDLFSVMKSFLGQQSTSAIAPQHGDLSNSTSAL